jgi:hypothetical protein
MICSPTWDEDYAMRNLMGSCAKRHSRFHLIVTASMILLDLKCEANLNRFGALSLE